MSRKADKAAKTTSAVEFGNIRLVYMRGTGGRYCGEQRCLPRGKGQVENEKVIDDLREPVTQRSVRRIAHLDIYLVTLSRCRMQLRLIRVDRLLFYVFRSTRSAVLLGRIGWETQAIS